MVVVVSTPVLLLGVTSTMLVPFRVVSIALLKTTLNTGQYEVVFTNPMPNADYAVEATVHTPNNSPVGDVISTFDKTANGFKVGILTGKDGLAVPGAFSFAVHATNALPRGGTGSDAWVLADAPDNVLGSFNIASVTRPTGAGNGQYNVVNFTTPMPNTNYASWQQFDLVRDDYTIFATNNYYIFRQLQNRLSGVGTERRFLCCYSRDQRPAA